MSNEKIIYQLGGNDCKYCVISINVNLIILRIIFEWVEYGMMVLVGE